jgi:hypothetical protein
MQCPPPPEGGGEEDGDGVAAGGGEDGAGSDGAGPDEGCVLALGAGAGRGAALWAATTPGPVEPARDGAAAPGRAVLPCRGPTGWPAAGDDR